MVTLGFFLDFFYFSALRVKIIMIRLLWPLVVDLDVNSIRHIEVEESRWQALSCESPKLLFCVWIWDPDEIDEVLSSSEWVLDPFFVCGRDWFDQIHKWFQGRQLQINVLRSNVFLYSIFKVISWTVALKKRGALVVDHVFLI